jgi:hypothetical protein
VTLTGKRRPRRFCKARSQAPAERAVIERRITHPNNPALNVHVANAVAKDGPRDWRLEKRHRTASIDALIALRLERTEAKPAPVALLRASPHLDGDGHSARASFVPSPCRFGASADAGTRTCSGSELTIDAAARH